MKGTSAQGSWLNRGERPPMGSETTYIKDSEKDSKKKQDSSNKKTGLDMFANFDIVGFWIWLEQVGFFTSPPFCSCKSKTPIY